MAVSLQLPTDSFCSSSSLQKLSSLVQTIHPDRFRGQPSPTGKQVSPHNCDLQFGQDISLASHRSKASHPKPPVVPRLSLEVPRSELDERSEALDAEIDALMAYYESWSYLTGTPRIRTWERGHPWDLNDEFIHEDPHYDEERVNREALRAYLKEKGLSDHKGQVDDSDGASAVMEKPIPARGRPKQNPRVEAAFKKPRVVRSKANVPRQQPEMKSSGSDDSGEEGQVGTPTKKKSLGSGTRGRQDKAKKRQNTAEKNSLLDVSEQVVSQRSPVIRQPAMTARGKRGQARDSGELRVAGNQGKWKQTPASAIKQEPSDSQLENEAGGYGAHPPKLGAGDGGKIIFQPGPGSIAALREAFSRDSYDDE